MWITRTVVNFFVIFGVSVAVVWLFALTLTGWGERVGNVVSFVASGQYSMCSISAERIYRETVCSPLYRSATTRCRSSGCPSPQGYYICAPRSFSPTCNHRRRLWCVRAPCSMSRIPLTTTLLDAVAAVPHPLLSRVLLLSSDDSLRLCVLRALSTRRLVVGQQGGHADDGADQGGLK